jgi:HEAT repeat protein
VCELIFDAVTVSASELLEHEDPMLRLDIVQCLALEDDPANMPLLMKALNDPNLSVRMAAAWGLARLVPEAFAELDTASPEPAPVG